MRNLFTDTAEQDLLETLRFYRAPSAQGDAFNATVNDAVTHLTRWPYTGHRRRDLTSRDVCFRYEEPYLIAFQIAHDKLTVIAVLHGSSHVARILRKRFHSTPKAAR